MIVSCTPSTRYEELNSLLFRELENWRFPVHVSRSEVQAESIEALWQHERAAGELVGKPLHWLRRTAKIKLLEISRRNRAVYCSEEPLETVQIPSRDFEDEIIKPQLDFAKLRAWRNLLPDRSYAIEQCVMLDRPVSVVAREIGIKRATVSSWIRRSLRQLARDPDFQNFHNRRR